MNGTYFEMLPAVKPGNVDALTFICEPLNIPGSTFVTPVVTGRENLTSDFPVTLYPNPTNGNFWLKFFLNESSNIQTDVSDVNGRKIWSNQRMSMNRGSQQVLIPVEFLSSGVYFVEMEISSGEKTNVIRKKFTVMK